MRRFVIRYSMNLKWYEFQGLKVNPSAVQPRGVTSHLLDFPFVWNELWHPIGEHYALMMESMVNWVSWQYFLKWFIAFVSGVAICVISSVNIMLTSGTFPFASGRYFTYSISSTHLNKTFFFIFTYIYTGADELVRFFFFELIETWEIVFDRVFLFQFIICICQVCI